MCGIYCSNDLSTFEILEQVNRKRGNFSTGIFYCYNNANYKIKRFEGAIDFNKTILPKEEGFLYLGHNQAPTEAGRLYDEWNSHPFQYGDWVVAHNGVITNFHELADEDLPMHDSIVDSSVIPALLDYNEYKFGPIETPAAEIESILYVLEKLQGTYAVWIINIKTMNIYIARQGSTLFYRGSNVSSIRGKRYREVKEGVLYNYSYEGLTKVEEYTTNSPFLTL
tara:strand:+ start:178 stop:849 length:672 start_codon:yes stop_codon:yes gene_type:complete